MFGLIASTATLAAVFGLLALFAWQEQKRLREIRARIARDGHAGRPVPVLYRSKAWARPSAPEGAGVLFVEEARATLVVELLDKASAGKRTTTVFVPEDSYVPGMQIRKHAWVVVVRVTTDEETLAALEKVKPLPEVPHFIAPDTGLLVFGSEESAHDLRALLEGALRLPGEAPPPEKERAVLTVGRRGPVELWRIPAPGVWLVALVATGALAYESLLVRSAWYEWLPPTELMLAGVIPGTAVAYLIARRYLRRRWARTEFFADRIVFTRERPRAVPWADVVGYRDDSNEYVQLLRATGTFADPDLAVPTRDEGERVAVLRLLDERGVIRRDGQPTLRDVAGGV